MKNKTAQSIVVLLMVVILSILSFNFLKDDFDADFPEIENEIETYVSESRKEKALQNIEQLQNDLDSLGKDKRYSSLIQLALNYKLLGQKYEVREYLIQAIEHNQDKTVAYLEFAKIYAKDDQLSDSEKMYQKAIELEPESVHVHVNLIEFYKTYYPQKESLIQDSFDKARNATGENEQVLLLYAQWLEERGEAIRSLDIYKFILNSDLKDPYNIQPKIEVLFNEITR
jgi:tetratricopeptide (TPR) repeat protein